MLITNLIALALIGSEICQIIQIEDRNMQEIAACIMQVLGMLIFLDLYTQIIYKLCTYETFYISTAWAN